jgi:hypothetical protein
MKPLELPVIPEVSEDGTKRLYKTRYTLLETRYVALHAAAAKSVARAETLEKTASDSLKRAKAAEVDLLQMRASTLESKKVSKRLKQIAKELHLPFDPLGNMDQQFDNFMGQVLCLVRVDDGTDELAD